MPTFDASRIVDQIVFAAEHLTTETYLINFDELNPADILEWLARLSSARQAFDGFVQQLLAEHRSRSPHDDDATARRIPRNHGTWTHKTPRLWGK